MHFKLVKFVGRKFIAASNNNLHQHHLDFETHTYNSVA